MTAPKLPEVSILTLFTIDEYFLEFTFIRKCKQKLDVESQEALRLFEQALKLNLIKQVKEIGFPKFPGYQIAEAGFLTYRKKVKESFK